MSGTVPVGLLLLKGADIEKPDPDTVAFCDYVEHVAINDVGHSLIKRLHAEGWPGA